MTEAGTRLHARIRGAVTEITERLWGDLPAGDLETTGRTLADDPRAGQRSLGAA